MYLCHILSRSESELISRIYRAQKVSSSKSDWLQQVSEDLTFFNIQCDDDEIRAFPKERFKNLLKDKVRAKRM